MKRFQIAPRGRISSAFVAKTNASRSKPSIFPSQNRDDSLIPRGEKEERELRGNKKTGV